MSAIGISVGAIWILVGAIWILVGAIGIPVGAIGIPPQIPGAGGRIRTADPALMRRVLSPTELLRQNS
jgi:hypothetical protein